MGRYLPLGFPVFLLILLAGALAGCPKRPGTSTVAAPAPGAPGAAPAVPGASAPGAMPGARPSAPGAGAAVTPTTPASPREFVETEALKDIHFDFHRYDIRLGDAKILDENARRAHIVRDRNDPDRTRHPHPAVRHHPGRALLIPWRRP